MARFDVYTTNSVEGGYKVCFWADSRRPARTVSADKIKLGSTILRMPAGLALGPALMKFVALPESNLQHFVGRAPFA